jgi:mannosyltransferase OCH1-like enzyme
VVDEFGTTPSEVVDDHRLRSLYMQRLIGAAPTPWAADDGALPPRLLVQFWDDLDALPSDVQECLDSWSALESEGFKRLLFDDASATKFIETHFDERHVRAFQKCQHPAMRSDYFRYAFISKLGGFYVDADDVFLDKPIDALLNDGRLKLQPLCYDITTNTMCDAVQSASSAEDAPLIFYSNTTPLIAPAGHPIVVGALASATANVLAALNNNRDVQSLTGPGNLTACIVKHAMELERANAPKDFELLRAWETIAISRWPLSYRSDDRNWRHWEQGGGE